MFLYLPVSSDSRVMTENIQIWNLYLHKKVVQNCWKNNKMTDVLMINTGSKFVYFQP